MAEIYHPARKPRQHSVSCILPAGRVRSCYPAAFLNDSVRSFACASNA